MSDPIEQPAAAQTAQAETPEVSVVIPVRNGGEGLRRLLAALGSQTVSRDRYEVLVVNDCSTDDTVGIVRDSGFAQVIDAPAQRGSYAARNLAIEKARGEILAFTDGDCLPAPDWIESGLRRISMGEADILAGHIEVTLPGRPSISALVDASRFLDQQRYATMDFGATANLWLRREVFDWSGTFNENLRSGGDTEFGMRAVAAGARLRYASDVIVLHGARSRARDLARKCYRLGSGAAQHRRHATGALRERDRYWLHPGSYLPRGPVAGLDRLASRDIRPNRWQLLSMFWTQYLCVKLPFAFGNMTGSIGEWRASWRGAP